MRACERSSDIKLARSAISSYTHNLLHRIINTYFYFVCGGTERFNKVQRDRWSEWMRSICSFDFANDLAIY